MMLLRCSSVSGSAWQACIVEPGPDPPSLVADEDADLTVGPQRGVDGRSKLRAVLVEIDVDGG